MKRFFTFMAAVLVSAASMAQLSLYCNGQTYGDGATITCGKVTGDGSAWDPYMLISEVFVVNNYTDAPFVLTSALIENLDGESFTCCYGQCADGVTHKRTAVMIPMGGVEAATDLGLHFELSSATEIKTARIKVTLWNEDEEALDDRMTFTVIVTNDPAVLAGVNAVESAAKEVYVKDNVLSYNFAEQANRQIQLFDLTGKHHKTLFVADAVGAVSLEGMPKGLHLYRVVEPGKKSVSGKFLIK